MKLLRSINLSKFDLAIYGLGYESRSIFAYEKYKGVTEFNYVFGYTSNQYVLNYQKNKNTFKDANVFEVDSSKISEILEDKIKEINREADQPHILLDITVMTRHRLALTLSYLLKNLKKGGRITICYIASKYVSPPTGMQPVREVGPLIDELSGGLGNLSFSTSAIFGLGYEHSKALGIYNYLEPDNAFTFIPKSLNNEFENDVKINNQSLINSIPDGQSFFYNVYSPFDIYVDLKSLVLALSETSRVIIVPLGPKILSAISLIIGIELSPDISVWRVSSLHTEEPVDRLADKEIFQSLIID